MSAEANGSDSDDADDRTVIRPPSGGAGAGAPGQPPVAAMASDSGAGYLPVGERIGEFEITALVGEGGFGIVYQAWDHSLHRRVALKEYMPSSLAARGNGSQVQVKSARHRDTFEAGLKSFINEARLLASFDHPSLMKVYRFWEANGTAYMAMPLLEGTTLKEVLKGLGQPPDEAWLRSLLGPLTEALLVIHAEQCYHRDIAPDNVMLLPALNRWLLLDFGAARRVIGDMTQALTVILKPGYAPVEQYAETPGMKQGPWTDVYALAAVVYAAIIGRTPPPAVGRLLNDTYVPLLQAAAGRYSERFLAAVDHALAVRPEERTQTISQFRSEMGLDAATAGGDVSRHATWPAVAARSAAGAASGMASGTASRTASGIASATASGSASGTASGTASGAAPKAGAASKAGIALAVVAVAAVGGYWVLAPKTAPGGASSVATGSAATGSATTGSAPPATAPAAAPATAASAPGALDAAREFDRIAQASTPGFEVRAQPVKQQLRIGRDDFQFSVQSEREGYLYVYAHASDGTLALLVPNTVSGAVRLRPGQAWRFPTGNGFVIESQEPAGATEMLVMVSKWQRNHDALRPRAEGPVRVFASDAAAALRASQHSGPGSQLAGTPICPDAGACVDEFGAAVMRFETVR